MDANQAQESGTSLHTLNAVPLNGSLQEDDSVERFMSEQWDSADDVAFWLNHLPIVSDGMALSSDLGMAPATNPPAASENVVYLPNVYPSTPASLGDSTTRNNDLHCFTVNPSTMNSTLSTCEDQIRPAPLGESRTRSHGSNGFTIDPSSINSNLSTCEDQMSDNAGVMSQPLDGNSTLLTQSPSREHSLDFYGSMEALSADSLTGPLSRCFGSDQPSPMLNIVADEGPTVNLGGSESAHLMRWQFDGGTASPGGMLSIPAYNRSPASSQESLLGVDLSYSSSDLLSPGDHRIHERSHQRRNSSSSRASCSSWPYPCSRSVSPATSNASVESEFFPTTPEDLSDSGHSTGLESNLDKMKINVTSPGVRAAANKRRVRPAHTYQCELCEESLTSYANLKGHMNSHKGLKPYCCTVANCDRSFARDGDRKRHEKEFHHPAAFTCEHCGHDFKRRKAFLDHQSKGKCCPARGRTGVPASECAFETGYKLEE